MVAGERHLPRGHPRRRPPGGSGEPATGQPPALRDAPVPGRAARAAPSPARYAAPVSGAVPAAPTARARVDGGGATRAPAAADLRCPPPRSPKLCPALPLSHQGLPVSRDMQLPGAGRVPAVPQFPQQSPPQRPKPTRAPPLLALRCPLCRPTVPGSWPAPGKKPPAPCSPAMGPMGLGGMAGGMAGGTAQCVTTGRGCCQEGSGVPVPALLAVGGPASPCEAAPRAPHLPGGAGG